jgi:hypothetical protein
MSNIPHNDESVRLYSETFHIVKLRRIDYVLGYKGKSGALLYHRAQLFSPIQQEMPRPLPSMKHQISFDDYG